MLLCFQIPATCCQYSYITFQLTKNLFLSFYFSFIFFVISQIFFSFHFLVHVQISWYVYQILEFFTILFSFELLLLFYFSFFFFFFFFSFNIYFLFIFFFIFSLSSYLLQIDWFNFLLSNRLVQASFNWTNPILSQIDSLQIDSDYSHSSSLFKWTFTVQLMWFNLDIKSIVYHQPRFFCISYSNVTKTHTYRQQFISGF